MLRENDPRYDVRETDDFNEGWREAVRNGYINQMFGGFDLAAIKEQLARDPYRVPPNAGLISDLRVITYERRVRIWYCIVEDDRIVYLERVTTIDG